MRSKNLTLLSYPVRQKPAGRLFEQWPEGLDVSGDLVEFVRNEVCQCVGDVLEELKPEHGEALRMVDIEEQAVNELAKQSGITANNANVRVHCTREALRKQVRMVCGSCAEHRCVDCRCKHS